MNPTVSHFDAKHPLGPDCGRLGTGGGSHGTFYLRCMKRILDFVFALAGLILTFPILLICAVAIRLDSQGPVFFRQRRVGKHGRPFEIVKLRSMVDKGEGKGLKLTASHDSRITRVGKWLRRTKIDEIPQLINVLKGEMSFVGTRPEVPEYVSAYTNEQRKVFRLKPGITGPASLAFIDEEQVLAARPDAEDFYLKTLLQRKLDLDLAYCESVSFLGDVRLILSTVRRLFGIHKSRR